MNRFRDFGHAVRKKKEERKRKKITIEMSQLRKKRRGAYRLSGERLRKRSEICYRQLLDENFLFLSSFLPFLKEALRKRGLGTNDWKRKNSAVSITDRWGDDINFGECKLKGEAEKGSLRCDLQETLLGVIVAWVVAEDSTCRTRSGNAILAPPRGIPMIPTRKGRREREREKVVDARGPR